VRIIVDMNLTPRWVAVLAESGHHAHHWSSLGHVTALDSAICEYARKHDFTILTNDLDFPQILAHTAKAKPSVILLRGEPLVPELRAGSVLAAIDSCSWNSKREPS
jgi:predicted nuclease of predicted toxin-antitoxin system